MLLHQGHHPIRFVETFKGTVLWVTVQVNIFYGHLGPFHVAWFDLVWILGGSHLRSKWLSSLCPPRHLLVHLHLLKTSIHLTLQPRVKRNISLEVLLIMLALFKGLFSSLYYFRTHFISLFDGAELTMKVKTLKNIHTATVTSDNGWRLWNRCSRLAFLLFLRGRIS